MCVTKTKILFVCMGNICRSPAAESLFRTALEELDMDNQFEVDSAGTGGWHAGNPPDRRMRSAARKQGFTIQGTARQITVLDLTTFDFIFCMDQDNYDDVIALGGNSEKTMLILPYVGMHVMREVPDPYYGGEDGFDNVITLINDSVRKLVTMLV